MPQQSLNDFLRKYHRLSDTEDGAKLQRMFMLAEIHPLNVIWQVGSHRTWKTFLRAEQLVSSPYLESFEEAMNLYRKPVIQRIGADAAVCLARIEPHLRALVLKRIDGYIEAHGMRPKMPMTYSFVRALRKSVPAMIRTRQQGKSRSAAHATRH